MPSRARHRLRRGPVVAGEHDDADAVGLQRRAAPRAWSALTGSAMASTPASRPSTATKIAVAPSPRSASASLGERADVDAELGQERRVAERDASARRPCRARPCRSGESKSATGDRRDAARPRRRARSPRPADARSPARRWRRGAAARPRRSPAPARRRSTAGLPSVSVPVLSTTSVSTFSMRSSASAFRISTPACAPRPTPTMIDIGVARPSAHGQAMMSTATAATSA